MDPRAEGGARIIIKESDRDESSLEKSSTDTVQGFVMCEYPNNTLRRSRGQ